MPVSYASNDLIKSFAQADDSHDDTVWTQLGKAASRAFEADTEVTEDFYAAAPAAPGLSTKTIRTNGEYILRLPPFVPGSLTTVTAETGYTFPDEWRVEDAETGRQFLIVEPVIETSFPNFDYHSNFTNLPNIGWTATPFNLTVTARWGWAEIPADVVQAVIDKAIAIWRNSDPAFTRISDVVQPDSLANYKATVQKYREKFSQRALFA